MASNDDMTVDYWREKFRTANRERLHYEGTSAHLLGQYNLIRDAYENLTKLNIEQISSKIDETIRESAKIQAKNRFIEAQYKHLQDKYKALKKAHRELKQRSKDAI